MLSVLKFNSKAFAAAVGAPVVLLITTLLTAGFGIDNITVEIACPGDLVGDNQIGLADLAIQLSNFGATSGAGPLNGDLDGDGDVDLDDLAILLAAFGTLCE